MWAKRLLLFFFFWVGCSAQPIFGLGVFQGRLYAVGWLGALLTSQDKGETWETEESPSQETLLALAIDDAGTRYIAGERGTLLVSSPGQAFRQADIKGIKYYLSGAWADARGAFVVGENGTILRSTDSGQRWQSQTVGKSWFRDVKGDSLGLYTVGWAGGIACSFDGGASWKEAKSGVDSPLFGVWGDSLGSIYVVGDKGVMLRSRDKCATFQKLSSGTTLSLQEILGRSAEEMYAVGAKGLILRSTDHGESWQEVESGTEQELYAIVQVGGELFAAGAKRSFVKIEVLP